MKFFLFVIIAILFWNSDGARQFTAESFNTLADVVQPDNNYWFLSYLSRPSKLFL